VKDAIRRDDVAVQPGVVGYGMQGQSPVAVEPARDAPVRSTEED
jgi:hypothetical protein